jgi:thiosulfate dehydrogenase
LRFFYKERVKSRPLYTNYLSLTPDAANTHPETYPKFQKQLGKVVKQQEMINWCIQNPLEGAPLALDDPKLTAMESYINYERRGVPMAPGKH